MNHSLARAARGSLLAAGLWVAGGVFGAEDAPAYWQFAPRPPMGWNSWDCYGATVTEAQTKSNADYMAARLSKLGWEYIVVDIQWYEPSSKGYEYSKHPVMTMDEHGRLWPVPAKFPSAADGHGFKPLADYVHGLGLKFGVHLLRGIPRAAVAINTAILGSDRRAADIADTNSPCRWNPDMWGVDMTKPGAQEYYNSVFNLFAQWGIDYVKVDDLSRPYHQPEVEAIRKAIDQSKRPMVFSTSPGDTPLSAGTNVMRQANLWRISDDFWDKWSLLEEQFTRLDKWTPFRGPGHWPDADMLPLGMMPKHGPTHFTVSEQRTLITLWCIARSPLMFGGDLPRTDDATFDLIANDEVLAVDRDSTNNRQLWRRGDEVAWTADAPGGAAKYVAMFNLADANPPDAAQPKPIGVTFAGLGMNGKCAVRDLWSHKDLGLFDAKFSPEVEPHGAAIFRLEPAEDK